MRTHRAETRHAVLALALVTAAVASALLASGGKSAGQSATDASIASSWRGLVGSRPRVALGDRVIVVLRTPSLAQRVAAHAGAASAAQERAWTTAALTAQTRLVARLARDGIVLHPDYSFARVLDGFSANVDPSEVPLVERDPDVAGVYPVRVAYPASVSTHVLARADFGPGSGHRAALGATGLDGRGVTIALLDTGVDAAVPYLRGRVRNGIDVLGGDAGAMAAVSPGDPSQLERHGTEMAGLLVGGGGPSGLAGVSTGAAVLPIRVAGWQPDALGHWSIYARSDQLIAGLDRAVDPNDDGDAHDAVRVALVALAEPFAGFADGPDARAVAGALALDTLVVAPAGNDGAAAASGDLSGPGGAPDGLTVGALDARPQTERAAVLVRSGLKTLLDNTAPLAGAVLPVRRLDLRIAAPRGIGVGTATAPPLSAFFTRTGASLVTGRAALVPMGASPAPAAERAAAAGASAVILYGDGSPLPAGALGLDESVPIPVVSVPAAAAHALLAQLATGSGATLALRPAAPAANAAWETVAGFSSTGPAFDGGSKPDVVAPGVALATADPGANADGSPRFVTVNGTSAAAAVVAGAAALLAQARPSLGAAALKSLLVGTAHALADAPVAAQGAGRIDIRAAVAGELAASPTAVALVRGHARVTFTLRNLSARAVRVDLSSRSVRVGARGTMVVHIGERATVTGAGVIVAHIAGAPPIRVPWAIAPGESPIDLIRSAALSAETFEPSDTAPALLSLDAGRVLYVSGRPEILPLRRLDIELRRAGGSSVGVLARMRDVLPGRYTFGLTGRAPEGRRLPPGRYVVRVVAYPVDGGPASSKQLGFTLR